MPPTCQIPTTEQANQVLQSGEEISRLRLKDIFRLLPGYGQATRDDEDAG